MSYKSQRPTVNAIHICLTKQFQQIHNISIFFLKQSSNNLKCEHNRMFCLIPYPVTQSGIVGPWVDIRRMESLLLFIVLLDVINSLNWILKRAVAVCLKGPLDKVTLHPKIRIKKIQNNLKLKPAIGILVGLVRANLVWIWCACFSYFRMMFTHEAPVKPTVVRGPFGTFAWPMWVASCVWQWLARRSNSRKQVKR